MRRKIVSVLRVLCVAAFLIFGTAIAYAAIQAVVNDTITETNVTPNPGGKAQMVSGKGTYTLGSVNGVQNTLSGVSFSAQMPGKKMVAITVANAAGGNWDGDLNIVAGNYDCWGTITTVNGNIINVTDSNKINVNVK